jgi:hypothetical protein
MARPTRGPAPRMRAMGLLEVDMVGVGFGVCW